MSGIAYKALGEVPKTAEGAVKLYDDWAPNYDDTLTSWGYEAPDKVAEQLITHVKTNKRAGKVLDLGCGTGLSGTALVKAGFAAKNICGVDISPASVEMAGKIYKRGCFVGSLEEPLSEEALKPGPYDGVICVGTMSYVHKFDVMFDEVLKALKPGGVFVFTHRDTLWDGNVDDIKTQCDAFAANDKWTVEHISEPSAYMPQNPDPAENSKRIRYVVCRKSAGFTQKVDAAANDSTEMKVTTKKGAGFYGKCAVNFLKGLEARPADGDKPAQEAKPAVDNLRISGIGEACNTAIAAASKAEAEGAGTIQRIQTRSLILDGSGRGCPHIMIDMKKK